MDCFIYVMATSSEISNFTDLLLLVIGLFIVVFTDIAVAATNVVQFYLFI